MAAFAKKNLERYTPQLNNDIAVQLSKVPIKVVTWDDKQNDEHHNRRIALLRFMNAGTKVILKYRLLKRLAKIKELLCNCRTKVEVKKLVE